MPTYTYQDHEELAYPPAPEGEFVFKVVSAKTSISKGAKTRGADQLDLVLECFEDDMQSSVGFARDALIFHDRCQWKVDLFLKASGYVKANDIKKGDEVTFHPEDLLGLRGRLTVKHREYEKNDGSTGIAAEVGKWHASAAFIEPDRPDEEDTPF